MLCGRAPFAQETQYPPLMRRSSIGWLWVGGQAVIAVAFVLSPWSLHGAIAVVLGAALCALGVVVAIAALRALGSALTPTPVPRDGSALQTNGIYRWIRHPIYTSLLTIMLGLLLGAGTGVGVLWWLVAIGFFTAKSRWEDRLLHERYGTVWEQWARTTGALLPRIRGRR